MITHHPVVRALWEDREMLPIGDAPIVGFWPHGEFSSNPIERIRSHGDDYDRHLFEVEEALVHHRAWLPINGLQAPTMGGFTDNRIGWRSEHSRLGVVKAPERIVLPGGRYAIESHLTLVMVPYADRALGETLRQALLEHAADVAWHDETQDRVLTSAGGTA